MFGPPLEKLSYIGDERLHILDTFKEQHEALLKVLQDSLGLATADLQRTMLAFHEFRSRIFKMVNNMEELEKQLHRKIKKTN